ncbi:uncharacterized protein [Rutidosis leptorrhynchoides]|uniref:uncharacterized protein n=1 Tax=Rutidosis leptorrhynchoides TaxID=125765 RepID=UPI003A99ADB6
MASDTESNTSVTMISKLEFNDPLYLHPSDTSGASLITQKLKGFIDGSCPRYEYEDDDVLLSQWDRCNSVVLTWILLSLFEDVYNGQIFSKTAESVWLELKETYDKIDSPVTFNLYQKINSCSQSGQSLSDYYHKLNAMWRQFDDMIKIDYMFLIGLDDVYVPIRSQILTSNHVPSVKTAFFIISRDESHKMHIASSSYVNKTQSSAFNANC